MSRAADCWLLSAECEGRGCEGAEGREVCIDGRQAAVAAAAIVGSSRQGGREGVSE